MIDKLDESSEINLEIPDHLKCPLTYQIFKEPLRVFPSGKVYEKDYIKAHVDKLYPSPMIFCPTTMTKIEYIEPAKDIESEVKEYLEKNPKAIDLQYDSEVDGNLVRKQFRQENYDFWLALQVRDNELKMEFETPNPERERKIELEINASILKEFEQDTIELESRLQAIQQEHDSSNMDKQREKEEIEGQLKINASIVKKLEQERIELESNPQAIQQEQDSSNIEKQPLKEEVPTKDVDQEERDQVSLKAIFPEPKKESVLNQPSPSKSDPSPAEKKTKDELVDEVQNLIYALGFEQGPMPKRKNYSLVFFAITPLPWQTIKVQPGPKTNGMHDLLKAAINSLNEGNSEDLDHAKAQHAHEYPSFKNVPAGISSAKVESMSYQPWDLVFRILELVETFLHAYVAASRSFSVN